ncbi:hypothetical protein B0X71_01590 [Planococcus lenghuensis]|uniref:Uncharacterized protein n=1 Tax=Planococcus lenghuensis TaxID=2213202 RepID=A0A1Q2KUP4_9BACL|nr:hypothetical protein B0X71_01590 [Planococcus lenghuensis]
MKSAYGLANELDKRKAQAPCKPRRALEDLPKMALFAIAGKAEATRGAGRWSLDNKKSEASRADSYKVAFLNHKRNAPAQARRKDRGLNIIRPLSFLIS